MKQGQCHGFQVHRRSGEVAARGRGSVGETNHDGGNAMTTDTSERGLERLICAALTGQPCDPPKSPTAGEPLGVYGEAGWVCGNAHDYDREYCVDLVQLA